ncbi:hypothetical protein BJV78DRAFT_240709 [Lactifluus subvellereus]|nr:hypothetical protein BJV78DRAFT_240709 [Lactifluus subvellereus]
MHWRCAGYQKRRQLSGLPSPAAAQANITFKFAVHERQEKVDFCGILRQQYTVCRCYPKSFN